MWTLFASLVLAMIAVILHGPPYFKLPRPPGDRSLLTGLLGILAFVLCIVGTWQVWHSF